MAPRHPRLPRSVEALRTWLAAGALVFCACQSTEAVDLGSIPGFGSEVRWLAVYGTTGDGVTSVTPLQDRESGAPILAAVSGRPVIIGWSAPRLAPVLAGDDGVRALSPARSCEKRLPRPDVAVAVNEDRTYEALPIDRVPPLTGDWIPAACPRIAGGGRVAIVREDSALPDAMVPCGARIEQRGCSLFVTWRDVQCFGPVDLKALELIDAEGTACGESGSDRQCTPTDAANLRFSCKANERTWVVEPVASPLAPAVEVVTATIPGGRTAELDPGGKIGPRWRGADEVYADMQDLVVLDDRAIAFSWRRFGDCASIFAVFDLETVERRSSDRTWKRCFSKAIRDEHGPGFVAIWSDPTSTIDHFNAGRFDPDGNLLGEAVPLRIPPGPTSLAPTGLHHVRTATPSLAVTIVGTWVTGPVVNTRAHLFVLDPVTLRSRTGTTSPFLVPGDVRSTAPFGDGQLAIADDASDDVFTVDLRDPRTPVVLPGERHLTPFGPVEANAMLEHPGTGRLLVVSPTGRPPGIFSARPQLNFENIFIPEPGARPTALALWPPDPRLVALGTLTWSETEPEMAARVLFHEPATGLILSGAPRIGSGLITRIRPDRKGRLWFLMPWTGQVARVSAR